MIAMLKRSGRLPLGVEVFAVLLLGLSSCTRATDNESVTPPETPHLAAESSTVPGVAASVAPGDPRGNLVPRRHPEAAIREYEGEAFIVLPNRHEYKILNEVGTRIWALIDGERTAEQIARIIASEYEVSREVALSDILEFLQELRAAGLLADAQPGK